MKRQFGKSWLGTKSVELVPFSLMLIPSDWMDQGLPLYIEEYGEKVPCG
jgi:hypothetical protein